LKAKNAAILGVSFDTVLRKGLRQNKAMAAEIERYRKDYCVNDAFLANLDKLASAGEANSAKLQERRISYVLKTGANWAGPIKEFRLVIDKGDASSLVSFCGDGIKKISPTQFEMKKTDYTPEGDLGVLILKKLPPP